MQNRISLTGQLLAAVFIAVTIVSCNNSGNNKKIEKAQQTEVQDKEYSNDSTAQFKGAPSSPLADGHYTISPAACKIEWFCVVHKGYVLLKSGNITVENNKITKGEFEILMDSIVDVDIDYYLMNATLVNTLKSDMFFNIEKYPVSTFTITNVSDIGDNRYKVTGDLKITDKEKPLTFISNITTKGDTLFAKSERISIDRTKWGITIYSKNYPQTDDSFLFTDFIDFIITLKLLRK